MTIIGLCRKVISVFPSMLLYDLYLYLSKWPHPVAACLGVLHCYEPGRLLISSLGFG